MACHMGERVFVGFRCLEETCISVIAANFGRYLAAFKQHNSKVPEHHLQFLERHYSERIFSSQEFKSVRLSQKLTLEHLDFFINPYIKELDLVYFLFDNQEHMLTGVINKLKTFGKNILSFKASMLKGDGNIYSPLISLMPNLETIHFQNLFSFESPCLDERFVASILPYGRQEEYRCFPASEITEAIRNSCPFLKVLKFPVHLHYLWGFGLLDTLYTKTVNAVSTILRHFPNLEVLDFADTVGVLYEMHKDNQKARNNDLIKCQKYALRTLSSCGRDYPLHCALQICVTLCPRTSSLNIHRILNDAELEQCSHFDRLEDITFRWITGVTEGHLNQFLIQKGSKLISMKLHYIEDLSIVTLIQSCPRLQKLKLRYPRVIDAEVTDNAELLCEGRLPSLRKLEFEGADFRVETVSTSLKLIFSAAIGIKTLTLSRCRGISEELLGSLDLSHISKLKIRRADIPGDSLVKLLLQGNLSEVEIRDCLSYEEKLKLRNFRGVKIVCGDCEKQRLFRSELCAQCFEECGWCNEQDSSF